MGHKQEADVDSRIEADHTTLEGARSAAIAYWKDGSGDRGLFQGSFGSRRRGVSILQREGRSGSATAQLRRDGCKRHGMGVVDWISCRIGLITGRFLDLR